MDAFNGGTLDHGCIQRSNIRSWMHPTVEH